MDRLLSIELFVKSVELGSFSAVASSLDISPQLVGKHIRELELYLGVRLLNRTTRTQHLTDFGHSFYERAKVIQAELEAARTQAHNVIATPTGILRISAPVSFGINTLSPLLPKYMKMYPNVKIQMSVSNRMVDVIDEGFDVIFRVGVLPDSGLVARSLAPYKLVLCASPQYLSTHSKIQHPYDLEDHECLAFSYPKLRDQWTFLTASGEINVPISGHLMVDSGEALMAAAIEGAGLIVQPSELVERALAEGMLIEVLPDYPIPNRPMHLLYAPDRGMTPKLRSFIDFSMTNFVNQTDSH